MSKKHVGSQSIVFEDPPSILGYANVVGKKEGEGPLAHLFDFINEDTKYGQSSWEKAESEMQRQALTKALQKSELSAAALDYVFAGDLLNQCISSTFAMRDVDTSFLGVYGACSTMAESLSLAAVMIDGGFADYTAAITSSHFASAERQYRVPLEYGGQRPPTAQWTVTGAGAVILSKNGQGPYINAVTTGKIVDKGIKDANNMGAAMAPAAFDTISAHFRDLGKAPTDYDLIVTGDLGQLGKEVLINLFRQGGLSVGGVLDDCGTMIFDLDKQDVQSGGSGCGCSAVVLTGYILNKMKQGKLKNVLFAATGALLSPISTMQGESIPSICHALSISTLKG